MNEFTAKKSGEVLAFATVGLETIAKGEAALEKAFGKERVAAIRHELLRESQDLKLLAENEKARQDILVKKSEATSGKLRQMRDLYVGKEWENSVELLEWLSFFEGAAIVHWHVARGAAAGGRDESLSELASSAIAFHRELLADVSEKIEAIAREKGAA